FNRNYSQLSAGEQRQVDDVILNLMSYHGTVGNQGPIYNPTAQTQTRLTEGQLDRWTDAANGARAGVCDGTTVCASSGGPSGVRSSANPFGSVATAVSTAAARPGSNIVIMRPGTFSEAVTINPPPGTSVTLRATRQGAAVIQP